MKKENQYRSIAVFEGIILAGIFLIYLVSKIPATITEISLINPEFAKMKKEVQSLKFDLVRAEDITNILLATQEFINEKEALPKSLHNLDVKNFNDPETNQPYYFRSLDDKFIFCVYFSNRIRGVNIDECPLANVSPSLNQSMDKNLTAQVFNQVSYNRSRLVFTVIFTIGVLFFSYVIYLLIKRVFYTSS